MKLHIAVSATLFATALAVPTPAIANLVAVTEDIINTVVRLPQTLGILKCPSCPSTPLPSNSSNFTKPIATVNITAPDDIPVNVRTFLRLERFLGYNSGSIKQQYDTLYGNKDGIPLSEAPIYFGEANAISVGDVGALNMTGFFTIHATYWLGDGGKYGFFQCDLLRQPSTIFRCNYYAGPLPPATSATNISVDDLAGIGEKMDFEAAYTEAKTLRKLSGNDAGLRWIGLVARKEGLCPAYNLVFANGALQQVLVSGYDGGKCDAS